MDSRLYREIGKAVKNAKKKNASLTEQNLLYVVKVATDMSNKSGVDIDRLIPEGVIGMMKAEEKYDPSINDSFTKYAAPSVRGYILNEINRQSSLVHIPANHMPGFKKGQERSDSSKVEYNQIDSSSYDTLGMVDNEAFTDDREAILQRGLSQLDINGRIAIEMKLHLGKYSETLPNSDGSSKLIYKYKNDLQSIANELEVPVGTANKIYKDAISKLSKFCQSAANN